MITDLIFMYHAKPIVVHIEVGKLLVNNEMHILDAYYTSPDNWFLICTLISSMHLKMIDKKTVNNHVKMYRV